MADSIEPQQEANVRTTDLTPDSTALAELIERQQEEAEREWVAGWLEGPKRIRWESIPVQVGEPAPDLSLPDTTGTTRQLSDFWPAGPTLLLFLRHFGCSCLAERWEKLRDEVPEYEAAGAQLIAIGQGEPGRTAAVARRRGYPFPVLADPQRRAYQAYGLLQGTPPQLVHDFPWRPGDTESAEKIFLRPRRGTERAVVDDPWQLPGEFVIDRSGTIVLAHRYQYCEDFPPKTVLLGAIAAAAAQEESR